MAGKKVLKARPKIYIADAAIRNAVLMNDSLLIDPAEMGKIVELCGEASAAIIVTKTAGDFGVYHTKPEKDMLPIPAFAFLYLLGHAEKHGYWGIG